LPWEFEQCCVPPVKAGPVQVVAPELDPEEDPELDPEDDAEPELEEEDPELDPEGREPELEPELDPELDPELEPARPDEEPELDPELDEPGPESRRPDPLLEAVPPEPDSEPELELELEEDSPELPPSLAGHPPVSDEVLHAPANMAAPMRSEARRASIRRPCFLPRFGMALPARRMAA
jgi:hypothetical protein